MLKEMLGKKMLFFDGGMGTLLQKNGLKGGEIPEYLNITDSDAITSIHRAYIDAGSDIITTNTFGANGVKALEWKCSLNEIITAAVTNVKNAIASSGTTRQIFTALDMGPTGKLLEPLGDFTFDSAYEAFKAAAVAGEQAGADLVIIETMSDLYEAKAAVLAVKENTDLPVFCTMTFDEKGQTLTGASAAVAAVTLEGLGVDAIGANCGLGPSQIYNIVNEMHEFCSVPIIVQPNAGLPKIVDGCTVFDVDAVMFSSQMEKIARIGVSVMGGCCGTTPEYIRNTVEKCKSVVPNVTENENTYITSYCRFAELGKRPLIIGERINPTGKKKLKEALRANDMEYIMNEAISQVEAGADVLDINTGLPEICESDMMIAAIKAVTSCATVPLQIDSADPAVLERALRYYNGKPIINSVNGKQETMDLVFPLAAKYGGVVIGLTLDEDGIPATAEGRKLIAERIVSEASRYGIRKKDILIDALTMTVSTGEPEAKTTLEALRLIKDMGVKTVLGVSNVSFGLPRRELVNSTFFALALNSGLDACIINPCSESMMNAYYSYLVLSGIDDNCAGYIERYNGTVQKITEVTENKNLYEIIVKGLRDIAYAETEELLKTTEPMAIINQIIIPALNYVGGEFEKGIMFLPQLMTSAATVQNAFEAIKKHIESTGDIPESKGTIILATVKGDVHDIGKNIVKVLLENYGYKVVDLGKDVPEQHVVEAIKNENADLCGLSALMTTTVSSMETTIKAIRQAGLTVKILVGGAVLTEEYAKMIGADAYAKDALAAVEYANKHFEDK